MANPIPLALVTLALVAMLTAPAAAEERPQLQCLTRAEQRAAIAAGEAIPLAAARQRASGELVRARLCRDSRRLIYLLTVLARDGKVRQVTVDATNGTVISGL
jgi:uncharacterized membrane protein YkoI